MQAKKFVGKTQGKNDMGENLYNHMKCGIT